MDVTVGPGWLWGHVFWTGYKIGCLKLYVEARGGAFSLDAFPKVKLNALILVSLVEVGWSVYLPIFEKKFGNLRD